MSATRTWLRPPCLAVYSAWSAVDELHEQRRLTGRGHADADGELQATGKSCGRDLGANALSQSACTGLGRFVEDEPELLASVPSPNAGSARTGFQGLAQLCKPGVAVQMPEIGRASCRERV